ncbi:MAG: rhodanese-like domain-containing protein [Gammaproteobacteria bacterium]|nr:rhodanese-like domain-containing protein [Gammaproteobacteria bacterium]
MKRFVDLIAECLPKIKEVMPWDIDQLRQEDPNLLILDIREPYEYETARIDNSLNVPRGILETACEYGYEETIPELVKARERPVLVICRSGNRSALAAYVMQQLGYRNVASLKTGLRGWNDYELPLIKADGQPLDMDDADEYFTPKVKPEQMPPKY